MHFCHEELFAFLMLLPGIRLFVARMRAWWHRRAQQVHGGEICSHAERPMKRRSYFASRIEIINERPSEPPETKEQSA